MNTNDPRRPGDIEEGPVLPELPQHQAGDTLTPTERAEFLVLREARRADAERAAERARTGDTGGIY